MTGAGSPSSLGDRQAVAQAARLRGWPPPTIYAEEGRGEPDQRLPELDRLKAAIAAGRHDALLLRAPGDPAPLMKLLMHCTKHGVAVSFVPAAPAVLRATAPAAPGPATAPAAPGPATAPAAPGPATAPAAAEEPPVSPPPVSPPPVAAAREPWSVLTRARLQALAELFPGWRIWLDHRGWHARRRGDGFLQGYRPGAPAFYVQADTATELAAQLCWQRAVDVHAPDGCHGGRLAGPAHADWSDAAWAIPWAGRPSGS
jgi:hypothetical protein